MKMFSPCRVRTSSRLGWTHSVTSWRQVQWHKSEWTGQVPQSIKFWPWISQAVARPRTQKAPWLLIARGSIDKSDRNFRLSTHSHSRLALSRSGLSSSATSLRMSRTRGTSKFLTQRKSNTVLKAALKRWMSGRDWIAGAVVRTSLNDKWTKTKPK